MQKAKGLSVPLAYIKYDAIIVASAARYKANQVIAIDAGVRALSALLGLKAREPKDFLTKQVDLDLDPE